MDYLILLIVLAVLGLSALYGYKKGLVKILLSMVALLVTFIVAAILTIPVSGMLKAATPIDEGIEKSVSKLVTENEVVNVDSISNLNLPSPIEKVLVKGAEAAKDGFNEYIVGAVADVLLKAITFFVLIIVVYVVVTILINVLDFISRLPLINSINKTGGLAVGLVQGLLLVWVGCLIVTAFANEPWGQEVFRQINANPLLTFIYNNNLITVLITTII